MKIIQNKGYFPQRDKNIKRCFFSISVKNLYFHVCVSTSVHHQVHTQFYAFDFKTGGDRLISKNGNLSY